MKNFKNNTEDLPQVIQNFGYNLYFLFLVDECLKFLFSKNLTGLDRQASDKIIKYTYF